MHLKCKKKKLLHFLEGGTWQGIGVFSSVLVFCLFGRKSDTFCDCFHFVLVWKPSWCLRETLGARREAGGPRAQGPEEAKPKVYVVLGVDPSAGALIKALGAGHFFFFFFSLRSLVGLPRRRCFVECSLVVAVVPPDFRDAFLST